MDSHSVLVAIFAAVFVLALLVDVRPVGKRSTPKPLALTKAPALSSPSDGTPVRLADAMRLSSDTMVPRLDGSGGATQPLDASVKAAVAEVVRRLNANGAGVAVTGVPASEARQITDQSGARALRVSFMVYDGKRNYASKLVAVVIAPPNDKLYVQSVRFATPGMTTEGAPRPFDSAADVRPNARYAPPEEVLASSDFGPGAVVQY